MILFLKKSILKQNFNPGMLGLVANPFYFARSGLYKNISELSHFISGRVLDVGCGKKPYKNLFKYEEYIGMEIEQSGHSHKDENIDVFYDGKKFPFEDESFDSAISNQVLEHVFNPNDHLAEIYRVLKPGGRFLISVPFLWDEHEQPYDYARYSSFGLCYLLETNGFKIVEKRKSIDDIRVIFQMINTYIYKKVSKNGNQYFNYMLIMMLTAPFNVIGSILNLVFPKNKDLYLDNIVIAIKENS